MNDTLTHSTSLTYSTHYSSLLVSGQMNEKEKGQLVAEVNILRELRHPCIVRYYDR